MTDDTTSIRNQKRKKNRTIPLISVNATDILLGRGKSFKNHPGNVRFQGIYSTVAVFYASLVH